MAHPHDSTSASKRYAPDWARLGGWPFLFVFIGAASYAVWGAILLPFYALRKSLVPPDAFFSGGGGTGVGDFLMMAPPVLSAFAIGMVIGRSVVRRIPPARRALEPELGDGTKLASRLKKYARWGLFALIGALPLSLSVR
jgi:hypothetical protein